MPTISSTCHLSPYWSTFTLPILSIIFPPSPQLNSLLPVSLHNFLFSFSFSSSFQSTVISSLFFLPSPFADHSFPFFTFFLPLLTDSPSFHVSLLSLPFLFLPFFITIPFFTSSCFCNHFFLIVFLYFSLVSSLLSYSYHPSSITVFLFSSLLCHPIRPYQFSSFT